MGDIEQDQELLRLLGGFDLFLQGKDRDLIVPDASKHKELWPILGRPGAVLHGTEIVGSWRPKTAGGEFTLRLSLWTALSKRIRSQLEIEAERLAAHRGLGTCRDRRAVMTRSAVESRAGGGRGDRISRRRRV